ncbi:MAG TPA: SRPBCC family protein [Lacunisphaera sp.]|jgi:hypothetical protein|nr:SRPBCC family protein [Lacunisphaera sp.]
MLTTILLLIAGLLALLAIVAALQPSTFAIKRQALIHAPAAALFAQVNELENWRNWSPWEEVDPALKRTYSGPRGGVGATYSWEGNNKVGTGRMTITDIRPDEAIWIKLEFFKPMAGLCTAQFTFRPDAAGTEVTWTMTGRNNFLAKLFCLIISSEKMIGGQFEKGLAKLKALLEAPVRV